jgi:hypothetical protein
MGGGVDCLRPAFVLEQRFLRADVEFMGPTRPTPVNGTL